MNYIQHLTKYNALQGGSGIDLWRMVAGYNLARIFWRPTLARLIVGGRYKQQRKLFYTIMTGGYDRLNEIPRMLPNWDYVCYTDNPKLSSRTWRVCLLENGMKLDPVRLSRHLKINSHLIDRDYDLSVYVDANLRIRGNLDSFVASALPPGSDFAILQHPFLHSLRQELEKCIREGKEDESLLRRQYEHYTREMGFADGFPHINARLMIRRSGRPELQHFLETWFSQLLEWSRRDQMSFNYSLSLCPNVRPHYIPYWLFRSYFKKMDHC